jgi:hypothetical protein
LLRKIAHLIHYSLEVLFIYVRGLPPMKSDAPAEVMQASCELHACGYRIQSFINSTVPLLTFLVFGTRKARLRMIVSCSCIINTPTLLQDMLEAWRYSRIMAKSESAHSV